MILDASFKLREEDVEAHFKCVAFICGIESYKRTPIRNPLNDNELYVDQQMQCCMKAQTLLVLYNMVESTVCDCMNYIYDAIADDQLSYAELTDEMRMMWDKSNKRAKKAEANLSEAEKMPLKVVFEEMAVNTSGNIDIRKIYDIFSGHGCVIPEGRRTECGASFLVVKNKRNMLAHGNVSFSQCGAIYLYSDLERMKKHILIFLKEVIEVTKEFVLKKGYKR